MPDAVLKTYYNAQTAWRMLSTALDHHMLWSVVHEHCGWYVDK